MHYLLWKVWIKIIYILIFSVFRERKNKSKNLKIRNGSVILNFWKELIMHYLLWKVWIEIIYIHIWFDYMKFSLNDRFNNSKKSARYFQISGGSIGEFYMLYTYVRLPLTVFIHYVKWSVKGPREGVRRHTFLCFCSQEYHRNKGCIYQFFNISIASEGLPQPVSFF